MRFPTIAARTLQGDERTMPADLPGERNLVLVAFKQSHQGRVDEWIARADAQGFAADLSQPADAPPATSVIEVPCIGRQWGVARRFIDGGMATSIRKPEILARTWTAYTDVGAVQRALDIPDSSSVWAFVVRAGGAVEAAISGDPSDPQTWDPIAQALRDS